MGDALQEFRPAVKRRDEQPSGKANDKDLHLIRSHCVIPVEEGGDEFKHHCAFSIDDPCAGRMNYNSA
jgi:hypothetical protein